MFQGSTVVFMMASIAAFISPYGATTLANTNDMVGLWVPICLAIVAVIALILLIILIVSGRKKKRGKHAR